MKTCPQCGLGVHLRVQIVNEVNRWRTTVRVCCGYCGWASEKDVDPFEIEMKENLLDAIRNIDMVSRGRGD